MKTSRTLYKESAHLFKSHWKKLVGLLAVFFAANLVLSGVGSLSESLLKMVTSSSIRDLSAVALALVAVGLLVAQALASWYVSLLGYVAPVRAVSQYDAGHNPSIRHVIKESLMRVFPYLWVTVLLLLAVVPFFLLFIVPGIYVSIILSMAVYANVLDGRKGLHALAYSRALYAGRFWKILGKSLMPLVYMIPAGIAIGFATAATAFVSMKLGDVWAIVVGIVLGVPAVVYAVRVGIVAGLVYLYKLYRNLSETASPEHVTVPRWLRVSPWVGLGIVVVGILAAIALNVTGGLRNDRGNLLDHPQFEGVYPSASEPVIIENQDGSSTFSDEVISFTYPADVTYIDARGSGDQTVAIFVDTAGYESEDDETPYVSLARFPSGEPQGVDALLSATKEYYAANAAAQGITYSVTRRDVNGVAVVEVEQAVASEGRVGRAIYVETGSALYTFAGSTLARGEARLSEIVDSLLGNLEIAE